MRTKKLIKLTASLLLTTFALTPIIKASGETKDEGLGGDYHYNAIILEDYNAKDADCEGNAIIGGNLNITGHHDFGTPVVGDPADKNGPTLVVGGDIVNKSPNNVSGDIVLSSEKNKEKLPSWMRDKVTIKDKAVIKERIEGIKNNLINMVEERIQGDKTEVIKLNESRFKSMEVNDLVKSNGKTAIVFVNYGDNFEFPNGEPMYNYGKPMDWGKEYKFWSSKIIWYFPNATEIKISEQVVGSVIAPNAIINTNSGNVNGHLLAKTLNQQGGFECHNNVFNPDGTIPPIDQIEEPVGSVKLKKVDSSDDKKVLEGAKFQLLGSNENAISEHVTDKDGIIKIDELKPGDYYFKEIAAPDGYKTDGSLHKFTIGVEGENSYIEMTVKNEKEATPPELEKKYGSVELIKVDSSDNEKVLEGAKFKLLDSNKEFISEHVTDKDGKIKVENLEAGEYYFVETEAPEGYKLDETLHKFTIGAELENLNIKMTIVNEKELIPDPTPDPEPEKKYGTVELIKVDSSDNEKVLEGAKFQLLDSNKEFISEHVTDKDGKIKIENLEAGEYYFVETEAPDGYKLDETPHKFTIGAELENLNIKITIENEKEVTPNPNPDPTPDPEPNPTPDPTPNPEPEKKTDTEKKSEKDKEEISKNETIKIPATGYKGYIGLSALLLGVGALLVIKKNK
ncbi:MSCRAMM family protein [Clostridium baratii]|uniref:MSCRAMM family protein n=1 Tax=Clostridium baratii TaxID=1561 RepID=UPI0006BAE524|nr:SpaA isopeptide-forming pilin-related protein [Clostridium baratii]